jgi:hypothetical protein
MVRIRSIAVAVLTAVALGCQGQPSAPTSAPTAVKVEPTPLLEPGEADWAEGYPKVIPAGKEARGAVELYGTCEAKPGWTLKAATYSYIPKAGGPLSAPAPLTIIGKHWGQPDPKDPSKVTPAKAPMEKGEWAVRVDFAFEGKNATGQTVTIPYQIRTANVKIE